MEPPANELPPIDLRQLRRMTDDTGLVQHAVYATPDPHHGYCIDDNARALIAAVRLADLGRLGEPGDEAVPIHTYLRFVHYAFHTQAGRFRNFMGYDRGWLEDIGSEDSQARGLWAVGEAVRFGPTPNVRDLAAELYQRALPGVVALGHARSWAFGLLGVTQYLNARPDHGPSREALESLGERLWSSWHAARGDDWPWWESVVTYDNAKLPHALGLAGDALGEPGMRRAALEVLAWLVDRQTARDGAGRARLSVIGNAGWLHRDGRRASFDQQPLEAYALVEACLDAARSLEADDAARRTWEDHAGGCFAWFHGVNDLGQSPLDPHTGGCRDGLHPGGVNRNQGAESVLSYVLATLELHRYARVRPEAAARWAVRWRAAGAGCG